MAQQFSNTEFKTRTSIVLFGKNWATPLVLYFEDPQKMYEEFKGLLSSPAAPRLCEYETMGPIKKVSFMSNQVGAVALQEEIYK